MLALIKKGLFYTFSMGTESLIAVALLPILTSSLNSHDYGLWVILFSFVAFLRPLLNLMFQDIIRMKYYKSSPEEILNLIKLSIYFPTFFGIAISSLHFIIPNEIENLLHFPSTHLWKIIIFAGLHGFYYLTLALLQFKERHRLFLFQQILQATICITLTIILLQYNIGWLSPVYARSFALAINCTYGTYWIFQNYGNPFTAKINSANLNSTLLTAIKFLPIGLASVLIPLTDRLIVSHLKGVEETSYLGIGGLFSSAIIIVATGFVFAWQPILYKAINDNISNQSIKYYSIFYFLCLPLIGGILSAVGVFAAPYMMNYDIKMVKPYIIWLNLATVAECFYLHNYVILKGRQRTNLLSTLATILIILNALFVYYAVRNIGGLGAAWGTAFSYLVMTLVSGILIITNKKL